MSEELIKQVEELKMDTHLMKHRLNSLEEEQLPRRVAIMEPVISRMEHKMDDLSTQVSVGLREVRDAINDQKSLQKGMVVAVAAVVSIIQFLPALKGFFQ